MGLVCEQIVGIKVHRSFVFSGLILPLWFHWFQWLPLSSMSWFLFLTLTLTIRLIICLMLIWQSDCHLLESLPDFPFCCFNCSLNLDLWVLGSRLIGWSDIWKIFLTSLGSGSWGLSLVGAGVLWISLSQVM